MKVLDSIKRTMESIEAEKCREMKQEGNEEFAELFEKYSDIPAEKLTEIIADIKEKLAPVPVAEDEDEDGIEDELIIRESEDPNKVEVKDASEVEPSDVEHTDANDEPVTKQINELDASEDEEEKTDEEELIITEEQPEEIEKEELEEIEEDEDFDVYKDELDIVDGDEKNEDAEKIDMSIPEKENSVDAADAAKNEDADKIDMNIPEEENSDDAADKAAKEVKNEDNNAAKAAIANRDNKGAFSSDIDALTDYLNDY